MHFWRNSFFCALSFLTIIRLPQQLSAALKLDSGVPFHHATYSFAFVGLVLGLGLGLVSLIFGAVAPFVMLLYLTVMTGFLHLDGLADTFDGLFSSRNRERMLEIMKDSRIGAMGAVAIILCLGGKFYAFVMMDSLWLLILIPAISRFAMVLLLYRMPYARKEGGLGQGFVVSYRPDVFLQIIVIFALSLLLVGILQTAVLLVAFVAIYIVVERWYARKIGGITGDLTGALCELMETGLFLIVAV